MLLSKYDDSPIVSLLPILCKLYFKDVIHVKGDHCLVTAKNTRLFSALVNVFCRNTSYELSEAQLAAGVQAVHAPQASPFHHSSTSAFWKSRGIPDQRPPDLA